MTTKCQLTKKFLKLFIKLQKSHIGASKFIGKKDKIGADKGAVDPMRKLNKINMEGTIVIGEGEWMKHPCFILEKNLEL